MGSQGSVDAVLKLLDLRPALAGHSVQEQQSTYVSPGFQQGDAPARLETAWTYHTTQAHARYGRRSNCDCECMIVFNVHGITRVQVLHDRWSDQPSHKVIVSEHHMTLSPEVKVT